MTILPPVRVLTTHKELRKLPVGAIVANGYSDTGYYLFAKTEQDEGGGYWKWYDPDTDDFHKQNAIHHLHPTWVTPRGFRQLNLPVYLLTKTGDRKEMRKQLVKFEREVWMYA